MSPLVERNMDAQRTLRRAISCVGIGLHSGNKVQLSLKPAPVDYGIRFRRTDLGDTEVRASVQHLRGINLATALSCNQVSVETVEHLLAALVSMSIDNVLIELNSPEVPIMDGSSAPFIYLIQEAGVKTLGASRTSDLGVPQWPTTLPTLDELAPIALDRRAFPLPIVADIQHEGRLWDQPQVDAIVVEDPLGPVGLAGQIGLGELRPEAGGLVIAIVLLPYSDGF